MKIRVLLALAVLATALLTWGSGSPRAAFPSSLRLPELSESQQLEAHHRLQEEGQVKEFKGKILKVAANSCLRNHLTAGTTAPICWMIKPPQEV
jgi:hypothetical protein